MARAQRLETGGTAGRVAARRRDAPRDGRTPARGVKKPPGKGKKARGAPASSWKPAVRLFVLMGVMALIGFFAVLVVDVSASLVGRMSFGETTLAGLWEKVVDRVLDRDVPRLPEKRAPAPPPARRAPAPVRPSSPEARAPVPVAPHPEEDARHVEQRARPDPQVEQAQRRLDDLLKRL